MLATSPLPLVLCLSQRTSSHGELILRESVVACLLTYLLAPHSSIPYPSPAPDSPDFDFAFAFQPSLRTQPTRLAILSSSRGDRLGGGPAKDAQTNLDPILKK